MSYSPLKFDLPSAIRDLVIARDKVLDLYSELGLSFTLDGNLIGDLGEAIAAEIFGLTLTKRNGKGIDGHAPDKRSVQVKASGTKRGPAFRMVDTRADHLLFFHLDLDACTAELLFNGPEEIALQSLKYPWEGQKTVSVAKIREADAKVPENLRLLPVDPTDKTGAKSQYHRMPKKPVSTLDRWLEKPAFKKSFEKEYKEFLLSELVHAIMAEDNKSVRSLAAELGVSKTVIQNIRSGEQTDMKLSNFLKMTHAYGFQLVLEKGDQRIAL